MADYTWRDFSISFDCEYVDGLYEENEATGLIEDVDEYFIANLKVSYRVNSHWQAFLGIDNIFNSNYAALKEVFSIELSDPFFGGKWKLANPLESFIYTDSGGGRIILDNIFTGHHVLLNIDSAELKYGELFMESDRWRIIFNNRILNIYG